MQATVRQVEDRRELLIAMLADSRQVDPLWRPTAYWEPYCARMERELVRAGLRNFRTNHRLLKGFAFGGVPVPTLPRAAWKSAVWRMAEAAPVVSPIVAEYRRLVAAEHRQLTKSLILHARHVLDELARSFPEITPPKGIEAGGAEDAFVWRDRVCTAHWVAYLCRVADFYAVVPAERVRAILEIGPGLGLSTLAHLALNPHLALVVNCDIPPVLYVSTQYLRAIEGVRVVDYLDWRDHGIREDSAKGRPGAPVVFQLAPWQLPEVTTTVEAAFNSFSFHEMERHVCANYAAEIKARTTSHVMLRSSLTGREPVAEGQGAPVDLAFLKQLFRDGFPRELTLPGLWALHYGEDPRTAVLLAGDHPRA